MNRSIEAESFRSTMHLRVKGEGYYEKLIESIEIPVEEHNKVFKLTLVPGHVKFAPVDDRSNFTAMVSSETLINSYLLYQ